MSTFVARLLVTPSDTRATLHLAACPKLDVSAATIQAGLHDTEVFDIGVESITATKALPLVYERMDTVSCIVAPCACVSELGSMPSIRTLAEQVLKTMDVDEELFTVEEVVAEVCGKLAQRFGVTSVYVVATDQHGSPVLHPRETNGILAELAKIYTRH